MLRIITALSLMCMLCMQPAHAFGYTIDPSHTYPLFEIDHLGFSLQHGQFNQTSGTVEFDQTGQTGQVEVEVRIDSLDTGNAERDAILKGTDWFDAAHYPVMRFNSSRFVFNGTQPVAVEGNLTLHGITRPLTLNIQRFKCGLNLAAGKRGCGADATGMIRRSNFGVSKGIPFVGDQVRLLIQIEAYLVN